MRSISADKSCAACKNRNRKIISGNETGLMGGILLAVLPKCPFCYMAFSGTLILCGKGGDMFTRTFSSSATQIFSVTFCLLILLFIFLSYKRTLYAIAFAVAGSAMVIYSTAIAGGLMLYYLGVAIIFFGVWLNAGLLDFIDWIKRHLLLREKRSYWV